MRVCVSWVCGAMALLLGAVSLKAEPSPWVLGAPQRVVASSGVFETLMPGGSYEIGAEIQFAPRRLQFLPGFVPEIIPAAGVIAIAEGSFYAYGGFRFEIPLGERWMLNPNWAAGLYYHRPGGFDLGGPLELRSGVELAYRLPDSSRLGLCIYHLSNAGFFDNNPGSESLVLTYSASLRRPRR